MSTPIISIIVGSYNRKSFLKKTIKTARENGITRPYEIIVVDGGSTDGSIEYLISQKDIVTVVQHNHGVWNNQPIRKKSWGYYMNIAIGASHGTYVVMISDDSLLVPGSIMNAYELFEKERKTSKKIGGVAFYWRNLPYEKIYYVRQTLGHKLSVNHGMYLKSALQEVGFCEEEKYPFYYGDGDLSLKLWKAGYSIIDCKKSFVEHFHFASMKIRQKNSEKKDQYKKIFMDTWKDIFYNEKIDNQSGKIFLQHRDRYNTARLFKYCPEYYLGILQSKLGAKYGYTYMRPDRLPSIEMLSNDLNVKYILNKFKITPDQLCCFAIIRNNKNEVLMGLREYTKGNPVWTFPGGRGQEGENVVQTLKREVLEEIGIKKIELIRVIRQKEGVKKDDRVYFVECKISEEPKLMEKDKFIEWQWFSLHDLPENSMDKEDSLFLKNLFV